MIKHLETAPKQHHVCTLSKYLNSQEGRSRDNKYPQISSREYLQWKLFSKKWRFTIALPKRTFFTYIVYVKVNCIVCQYN